MQQDFQVDTTLSAKQLNHQSTSVVIPHILRTRIHQSMFYKTNLSLGNMRGHTMLEFMPVLFKYFIDPKKQLKYCGGGEFTAFLLKLIEIKPTWEQVTSFIQVYCLKNMEIMKYAYALMMCYLRIQYYFIFEHDEQYPILQQWFRDGYTRYNKIKCLRFDVDTSNKNDFVTYHVDELIDRLMRASDIWGIPLGQCRWLVNEFDDTSNTEDD